MRLGGAFFCDKSLPSGRVAAYGEGDLDSE